ncbi:hypothetical protein [Microbispora hainanensis]|uniref:DUF4333 domain-containing protein n=1 Tax=Microbispora hainanensis TaxID=568844 RepID=A0ABZ1SNM0_9ACTN|nr:hypothetical protein [Microbispora hainanensis]
MRKRSMILAGVIMTVGLGIGGSTAASATSTGAPKPGVVCAVKGGPTAAEKGKTTVKVDKDGRVFVNGKEVSKSELKTLCEKLPLPGKGVVCVVHKKGGTFRGDTIRRVKTRIGRVFVDGKEIPKNKQSARCQKLPLPGKGVICIVHKKGEGGGFGTSDEKTYVDGKPVHATCPPPKKPGKGMDDVHAGDDTPVIITPN